MADNPLFTDFPSVTEQQWLDQIKKELKTGSFDDLFRETRDGIKINPAYTNITTKIQPKREDDSRELIEEVVALNAEQANTEALHALQGGASGILFYTSKGISIRTLLKDILIDIVPIHFVADGDILRVQSEFLQLAHEKGVDPSSLKGSFNADPIEQLARTGNWFIDEVQDFNTLSTLLQQSSGLRSLTINANIWHNAGATVAEELGITLAHIHEHLHRFLNHSNDLQLNMAIGPKYFEEIAKFRAIRRLFDQMIQAYSQSTNLHIYAENGVRNKTIYDPWVNMLRTTTEAMSALIGGVDEICVKPYDITFEEPSDFAKRIARNQVLVLQYESFMDYVNDPSAGAYFIEYLTDEIAKKAWMIFQKIEAEGGLISALKSGSIQSMIETSAKEQQRSFDENKTVLLGTNLYPNKTENMKPKATMPMYATSPKQGVVKSVAVSRLAEKVERERLNQEA